MREANKKLDHKRRSKPSSSLNNKIYFFEAKPSNCGKFLKTNLPN
jgi:hypothetical protein